MLRIRPIKHVVSRITCRQRSNSKPVRQDPDPTPPTVPDEHADEHADEPTKTIRMGSWKARRILEAQSRFKPIGGREVGEKRPGSRGNVFITLSEKEIEEDGGRDDVLINKAIVIKDNISTIDYPTTCASAMLKDFQSPYDATVVRLLREAGAHISGKTNMDEFGMGSHSTNSHFGAVIRPEGLSAGGSSGGSAIAVRAHPKHAWASLGTDTGGSVRLPAAYCRVFGFKPSYGRLSRWGVVSYANSLDTIGMFAQRVDNLKAVYNALNHYDPKDPTSMTPAVRQRGDELGAESKTEQGLRIGVPIEYNISELSRDVRESWIRVLERLQVAGRTIVPISLTTTQQALSAYYILAPAEASSNLAKYDGIRYGSRSKVPDGAHGVLFSQTRNQGLGEEVKRRILLGSYTLSADAIDNYFVQAQKIRRLVQEDFNQVFRRPNPLDKDYPLKRNNDGVDFILCPTAPTNAPTLEDLAKQSPVQSYMNDIFTVPASLAGLPAINVPVTFQRINDVGKPRPFGAGVQLIGQYGDDLSVLAAAQACISNKRKDFVQARKLMKADARSHW
ncbi:glutamyl-tRNA amidotransferase [Venturia nashicola]|uniref:Glutamyl-tRNA(Gln) amidotransferase subunit A, mitochondrial n=1 Tax=Venturia nashicola TaxID=86259 RepID=A0A4Z1PNU9_9PEZI|nr:glutamyl-tRNA amidotransferase [Venturia nashicola]TLD37686.1 glutamyl-tRNA amidotransferase [Venturia nashicola]